MDFNPKELFEKAKEKVATFLKPFIEFSKESLATRIAGLFVLWFFSLMPIWVTLFILWVAGPDTFWQGFAIAMVLSVILGIPQFILVCIAGIATYIIVDDAINDYDYKPVKPYLYREDEQQE